MLDKNQIENNKQEFINLLKTIVREGADIEGLIKKLEKSDFFIAPASTMYHCAYEGGLCYHSLNTYKQLLKLVLMEYPQISNDLTNNEHYDKPRWEESPISLESIIITSLLHDMSKMNFYKTEFRNTKDENGNWVKVPYIAVKPFEERFIFGNHEMNSLYMVQTFIPLTLEESSAIIHHMGGKSKDSSQEDLSVIFNKYPLATLLHVSDVLSTFIDERI